ncbi:MAG: hypothetical protein IPP99_14295 [Chitinophagaceae bacterium]|nr:hypothetical protein [Chitinophagaceae bacterium]
MSDYELFMEWFNEFHPALFKKYAANITISALDGKGVAVNDNNRISQKEFNFINHVANSYYSKIEVELFDRIKFVYADDVQKDDVLEVAMLNNVTMWLRPFITEINKAEGIVRITFNKKGINSYWVENIPDELIEKARDFSKKFQSPYQY